MQVIIIEDNTLPIVCYNTTFRVGSRNEYEGRNGQHGITGISHLFEHMMFNGSKKYPQGEFDRLLESNGGYSNAWTSRDMTSYYEVFPPDQLELVMDMERDRMVDLDLTESMLSSEREVVKEERRMSVDNSVHGTMWELLYKNAFPHHPYHWPIIGWMDDISALTLEECQAYYRKFYSPSNAVLVICGDVQAHATLKQVESVYDNIPPVAVNPVSLTEEPLNTGEKWVDLKKPAEIENFLIGYPGCAGNSEDVAPLDVLQNILLEGDSSRMIRRLVHQKSLAMSVSGAFHWGLDPDLFYFGLQTQPEASGEDLMAEFDRLVEEVIHHAVTPSELQKAKNQLTSQLIHEIATITGKAAEVTNYLMHYDDPEMLFGMAERYNAVTEEDVRTVAEKYLQRENRTVIHLIPQEGRS